MLIKVQVHESLLDMLFRQGSNIHASTVAHGISEDAVLVNVFLDDNQCGEKVVTFVYEVEGNVGTVVHESIIWTEGINSEPNFRGEIF